MVKVINFYLDESGSKCPDRKSNDQTPKHKKDFFAFGGVLVKQEDEDIARQLHENFCSEWKISYPLHSVEIRNHTENFHWLHKNEKKPKFIDELYNVMAKSPVIGIACTIDRPGYNHRYKETYGSNRWQLCKTAFNIVVERAAKYAKQQNYKLRILPEKCSKKDDNILKGYYQELINNGMPFDQKKSLLYSPLSPEDFQSILYEYKPKEKSSPMVQLADLYLWPMIMGGYPKGDKTYARLLKDRKLIDCFYKEHEIPYLGIKYSCFDLIYNNSKEASSI